jgi:transposase
VSGIWRLLESWGIRYKRGRNYLHSPDPHYISKRDYVRECLRQAEDCAPRIVALYLDELTYYRQPSLASDWSWRGAQHQPLARFSYAAQAKRRIVSTLNAVTGEVIFEQAGKIGVERLVSFYPVIRERYPVAEIIYVIQDNWPIHFQARVAASAQHSGIELVRLPTYAPWLNPIEKLWRKLKQEVLHLHRSSDEWPKLQQRVAAFLESFRSGSRALLRYVGLLPD